MLLFADGFAGLALFELGLGIGVSLVSGTDLAILYDSEQALEHDAGRRQELVGRLFTMQTASEAFAGVLCSVLRAVVAAGRGLRAGRRRLDSAADRAESRRAAR